MKILDVAKDYILFKLRFYRLLSRFTNRFESKIFYFEVYFEDKFASYLGQERIALDGSMVEPIRRALDYQDIGRKLLWVDPIPKKTYDRYNMEVNREVASALDQSVLAMSNVSTYTYTVPSTTNNANNNYYTTSTLTMPLTQSSIAVGHNIPSNNLTKGFTANQFMEVGSSYVEVGSSYSPLYVSSIMGSMSNPLEEEENILYNYLCYYQEQKMETKIEKLRDNISAIECLEL